MFGIRKLGLSLPELYEMAWNEFELRSYAFWEEEKQRIEEFQFMAYNIRIAPHYTPPKSWDEYKNQFKRNQVDKTKVADYMKQAMDKFKRIQENGG